MKKLISIILLTFLIISCANVQEQEMLDAREEFCNNVYEYQDVFVNDNPLLTDLQKETTLGLLRTAVGDNPVFPETLNEEDNCNDE